MKAMDFLSLPACTPSTKITNQHHQFARRQQYVDGLSGPLCQQVRFQRHLAMDQAARRSRAVLCGYRPCYRLRWQRIRCRMDRKHGEIIDQWLVLVSRYDASGALKWTNQFGSSNSTSKGFGISVSGSNLYITGATNGGINQQISIGTQDGFCVELDSSSGQIAPCTAPQINPHHPHTDTKTALKKCRSAVS